MLWAVSGKVPYFSALETGIRQIPRSSGVPLEVVLGAVSLVSIRVSLSTEVIAPVVPSVVPSSWCPVPVNVHWDRGIIHPSGSIGRVILGCVLSLGVRVVPLWTWLLRGKCPKVFTSSEHVS